MKIRLIVSTIFFVVILLYILIDLSISTKKFSYFKTLVPQEIKSSIKKIYFHMGIFVSWKNEIQTSSHHKTYFFIIEI